MNHESLSRSREDTPVGAVPTAPERSAVWLERLALTEFRNYAGAEIDGDGRSVVLTGPNGAGKTNLLEAISFLSPGRGLRRAKLSDVGRVLRSDTGNGASTPDEETSLRPWAVAATVMTADGPREIGTGSDPTVEPSPDGRTQARRVVKIDGALARRQQDLGEILGMVWLTPQMDSLFRDGASARRRFLDRLVYGFDPAHAGRLGAYEQALRERTRLLKAGQFDDRWLNALEDGMARHGVAVAAARRDLVARLAEACTLGVGGFPVAGLGLTGDVEGWLDETSALETEDRLRGGLAEARRRDAEAGGAALGPHRSDLLVEHMERQQPAGLCSTGEQKALLVSIVLAHARLIALHRGAAPLLLLDEVAAHLDETRRRDLFDEVVALGVQAWLSGTEAEVFAPLADAARFYLVKDATLTVGSPPRRA